MNLTEALDEIGEKEREKAQLDLLEQQLKDDKKDLLARMKKAGVKDAVQLAKEIESLEKDVAAQLEALREGRPIKTKKTKTSVVDEDGDAAKAVDKGAAAASADEEGSADIEDDGMPGETGAPVNAESFADLESSI